VARAGECQATVETAVQRLTLLVCAVSAASVIVENVVAFEVARALVEKFGNDSLAEMKKRAEAKKFPFTYLYDETQKIAKDYGATFTPEFFVINRERRIAYMGGFDDHSSAQLAKKHYLEEAVQQVAQGKQPTTKETVAIGCMIRYERERRKK